MDFPFKLEALWNVGAEFTCVKTFLFFGTRDKIIISVEKVAGVNCVFSTR